MGLAPSTVPPWMDGDGVNSRVFAAALLFIEHINLFDNEPTIYVYMHISTQGRPIVYCIYNTDLYIKFAWNTTMSTKQY